MKLPSKFDLILWGCIGLAVLGLFIVVKGWHDDSVYKLPKALERAQTLQENYDQLEKRTAENAAKTEKHGNDFELAQQKLEADRAATPVRDVRLCKSNVQKASRVTPSETPVPDHAAGSGAGELPEGTGRDPEAGAGPDIGPALYALIDKADKCALIATAAQEWIRENP